MMCYKDMTWCTFSDCKNKDNCHRYFTKEDRARATKWWGNEDFPLAYFAEKPDCFVGENDE